MKSLSPTLEAHLASGATTLSWCWRITRADGAIYGFTDHDQQLAFDGTTFEPESGLIASEVRAGTDLAVDAQDAEGVLTSDRITETDVYDGLWDNAKVEVWRVNWQDTSERVLLRRGATGQLRRGRLSFVAEMRSLSHVLNQTVGRTYQNSCDAELGDGRCKVDLEDPAYKGTGAVTDALGGRQFAASGIDGFERDFFALGVLEWTSGANAGRKAEIMRHDTGSGITVLTLLYEPVRAFEVGDGFVVRAGCDKRVETCAAKFDNVVNFRGFPTIPGQDAIFRVANKGKGNTGEVL